MAEARAVGAWGLSKSSSALRAFEFEKASAPKSPALAAKQTTLAGFFKPVDELRDNCRGDGGKRKQLAPPEGELMKFLPGAEKEKLTTLMEGVRKRLRHADAQVLSLSKRLKEGGKSAASMGDVRNLPAKGYGAADRDLRRGAAAVREAVLQVPWEGRLQAAEACQHLMRQLAADLGVVLPAEVRSQDAKDAMRCMTAIRKSTTEMHEQHRGRYPMEVAQSLQATSTILASSGVPIRVPSKATGISRRVLSGGKNREEFRAWRGIGPAPEDAEGAFG